MATAPGVDQGKSAFLESFLPSNRDSNVEAVNKAWTAAGNEGTVSVSLIAKIRSKLGLSAKRGRKPGLTKTKTASATNGEAKLSPKVAKGKKASKPVPPESSKGLGKTAFVAEMLGRDPKANMKAINGAWASAGNEGTISDSAVYKVKRELSGSAGTTSSVSVKAKPATEGKAKPTAKPRPESNGMAASTKPVTSSKSGNREQVLDQVEDRIDDLMFGLKQLGGFEEVLGSLRKVRRVVVRSHKG